MSCVISYAGDNTVGTFLSNLIVLEVEHTLSFILWHSRWHCLNFALASLIYLLSQHSWISGGEGGGARCGYAVILVSCLPAPS